MRTLTLVVCADCVVVCVAADGDTTVVVVMVAWSLLPQLLRARPATTRSAAKPPVDIDMAGNVENPRRGRAACGAAAARIVAARWIATRAARHVVSRFAPPLALMALIFALSAQPDLNSGLGTVDFVGRKLIHMTEYGLLFLLWLRAFGWRRPLAAAAIAVAYSATDEFHQSLRGGPARDAGRRPHRLAGHRHRLRRLALEPGSPGLTPAGRT